MIKAPAEDLRIAIFRTSMTVFSRAKGHTATAAAAYRSASRIPDERTGVVHNYTRRGGVVSVEHFCPPNAPDWARDSSRLWNAAEAADARVNSRTARELLVALPVELDAGQRAALAADLARLLVDRYGVAVMAAIHAPSAKGDARNHHTHLLFTTRVMGPDGLGRKVRVLDDRKTGPEEVEFLRARVAELTNLHLARAGHGVQVDHRRLEVQAKEAEDAGAFAKAVLLTRAPVRTEGKAATAARRRGERTECSAWNAAVRNDNRTIWESFLARAAAEGRLGETPPGAGADQARADRIREAGTAPPPTAPLPPTGTPAPRLRPRFGGGAQTARHGLRGTSARLARAHGPGAEILNDEVAQLEASLRTQAQTLGDWLDALQQLARELGMQADRHLEAFVRRASWSDADVRALVGHCARDPNCRALLRRGLQAHRRLERAESRAERRRNAYGAAMVATVAEQKKLDVMEADRKPGVWKPLSRREWADRRREQRARLEVVKTFELRAARGVNEQAMAEYAAEEAAARETCARVEEQRRKTYSIPGDLVRPSARVARQQHIAPAAVVPPVLRDADRAPRPTPPILFHRPRGRTPRL